MFMMRFDGSHFSYFWITVLFMSHDIMGRYVLETIFIRLGLLIFKFSRSNEIFMYLYTLMVFK